MSKPSNIMQAAAASTNTSSRILSPKNSISAPVGPKQPEWVILQKMIFTRWVNQKLAMRNLTPIKNCVTDLSGEVLIELLEILSQRRFDKKIVKNPKMKVQKIENANAALKFLHDVGVVMELPTSAENLIDGTEKEVLGMIWKIMSKFMKFGADDEQKLNAKDSLLMWVRNQTMGYKGVDVKDFGKSWHNGLAFCALIHKFRPRLIDYAVLDEKKGEENIQIAMNAAEIYFGLDQYLTPADIIKLDDKSMVVYVSEYYAGIAAQRKLDIAARRITKVVRNAMVNEQMKEEYLQKAKSLKELLDKWSATLSDLGVDNTLSGAQKKLDELYEYKTKDKIPIINAYLSLEALYNHLSLRLQDHKLPPFLPPYGLRFENLTEKFVPLEKIESERALPLYQELQRQRRLFQLAKQHQNKYEKLSAWTSSKKQYLETKENVSSSGDVEYQLNVAAQYRDEADAMKNGTWKELTSLGTKLTDEKFENSQLVQQHEAEIKTAFEELEDLYVKKIATLKDDLEREKFKERVLLNNEHHLSIYNAFKSWLESKQQVISSKEEINSVLDARIHLNTLSVFVKEKATQTNFLPGFIKLGSEITHEKYETQFSSYAYPNPDEIKERERYIQDEFAKLDSLVNEKLSLLKDGLAREEFKDKVLLNNQEHLANFEHLKGWIEEKESYLSKKESIDSVRDANVQLNIIVLLGIAKEDLENSTMAKFKKLGKDILEARYESKYSSYVFPAANEVKERESIIDEKWKKLNELYNGKYLMLKDILAREEFKEKILLLNQEHISSFNSLKTWIGEKEAYLEKKEEINSIHEARAQLNTLNVFIKSKHEKNIDVQQLQQLGTQVLEAKFQSENAPYSFPSPEEIKERESYITSKWLLLDEQSAAKKTVLEAALANELQKEKVRVSFAATAAQLQRWTKDFTESLAELSFGFSLQQVEEYEATLKESDEIIEHQLQTFQKTFSDLQEQISALGMTDNTYTQVKFEDCTNWLEEMKNAKKQRRESYEKELLTQRNNDHLCKKFADMAIPFIKQLYSIKDTLSMESKDDLQTQSASLTDRINNAEANEGSGLGALKDTQAEMDAANITHNPYTHLTFREVKGQWDQYLAFLERLKKQVTEKIHQQTMRGISPQQYAEIEEQFKKFDTNGKGIFEKSEFKACLFSLGYDFDNLHLMKIMETYGKENPEKKNQYEINREGFFNFMIAQLGDTDTEQEIIDAFKLVNKGQPVATTEHMKALMADDVVSYVTTNAPSLEDGYDYEALTKKMFASN